MGGFSVFLTILLVIVELILIYSTIAIRQESGLSGSIAGGAETFLERIRLKAMKANCRYHKNFTLVL